MVAGCSDNNNSLSPRVAHADDQSTVLDELVSTKGTEALVAAIQVVDSGGACAVNFAELLGDRLANLVLLAPSNEGFEEFLGLSPGALEGLTSNIIVGMLPGLLQRLSLDTEDLCSVLLKHVSVEGAQSKRDLLNRGEITVLNTNYPVAIGDNGVTIGYIHAITEPDVYTVNGVIHYLNSVIVEDPPPPPPHENGVCSLDECENNPELAQECQDFLTICLQGADTGADREQCVGAALLKCVELF